MKSKVSPAPAFPPSIRVGGMDYAVKPWSVPEAQAARALGQCDAAALTILLRADMHPLRAGAVLLHEVLHATYEAAGLSNSETDDIEERVVLGLGYQLFQVWRDNPALVRYFETVFGRNPWTGI